MGSSRFLLRGALAIGVLSLAGCGREAESRGAPPRAAGTVEALDALRSEIAALRSEVRRIDQRGDAALRVGSRLALELVDGGKHDPYLAERSNEMAAVARAWDEDGAKTRIERHVEVLKQRGHVAVAGIIPFLRDVASDTRLAALYVLRELGVAAQHAVPQIKERLRDPDAAVRAAAEDALCAIHYTSR